MKIKNVLLLVFLYVVPKMASAQSIVVIQPVRDQAAIYQKPDFDAKIIYLLPKSKKVYATKSTTEGLNGLGLFHKVKLNSKTFGYMLDTEIKILGQKAQSTSKKKIKNPTSSKGSSSLKDNSKPEQVFDQDNDLEDSSDNTFIDKINSEISEKPKTDSVAAKKKAAKNSAKSLTDNSTPGLYFGPRLDGQNQKKKARSTGPLIFEDLIGGQVGFINYTEDVASGKKSSNEWLLGFKLTGPNWLFRNLLADLSVSFHYGAPQFFDDFSLDASGFFILTELSFPFILGRSQSSFVYAAIGPVLNASFFDFVISGQSESNKNLSLGGVATLGVIYEMGDWALKVEPKYYFESSSYWGVLAGLQKRF